MTEDEGAVIRNPVLAGFNPDPSFLRVGEDYYLATSTFEWYPGVSIYHSRDLVDWRLVARPLNRPALLDMRGNPDSCGIWAPCLSHDGARFWLVYTDVKRLDGAFKDAHNYITCCATVDGDWRDPWYVNSSGFDPSLFHDEDGRKWFLNMRWNHRGAGTGRNPAHDAFDGILLQEWSPEAGLIGEAVNIYAGTPRGLTEAPHLFKRNGYYYLTTAEGGTGYDHAVTMARARSITGPYEDHPDRHVISAKGTEGALQRTGHGQYVESHWGKCYHSFLMGRPIAGLDGTGQYCPCGRETGLEEVVWRDDWLWLAEGGMVPRASLPAPAARRSSNAPPRVYSITAAEAGGAALPPVVASNPMALGPITLPPALDAGGARAGSVPRRDSDVDAALALLASNPMADLAIGLAGLPPALARAPQSDHPQARRYDFRRGLDLDFQWLRTPHPARIWRTGDEGLTLIGRESLGSWFEQALVARRQAHLAYGAQSRLAAFAPRDNQQAAGLVTYYNAHKFHALLVEGDGQGGRQLFIASCAGDVTGQIAYPVAPVPLAAGPLDLYVGVDHARQQFWWRQDGEWQAIGPVLDAAVISDEGGRGEHASFTGAFTGLFAMDIAGQGCHAVFTHFDYLPV